MIMDAIGHHHRRSQRMLASVFALVASMAVQAQDDPAMSPAVFEDVPPVSASPTAPPAATKPPAQAPADQAAIAVVTLQPGDTGIKAEAATAAPTKAGEPGLDEDSPIRFEDLPREIGSRVRVLTRGQRVHLGIVQSADARHVTLTVKQHGGSATFVLPREQIQRIDPS